MEFLDWLLRVAGQEIVSCAGGWIKTLDCFFNLQASFAKQQLKTLTHLLEVGLDSSAGPAIRQSNQFPLVQPASHILPQRSNPFAHLNLYGIPRTDETQRIEDIEDRQRIFIERYYSAFTERVENYIKEGGELGRAAAQVRKAIDNGLSSYEGNIH